MFSAVPSAVSLAMDRVSGASRASRIRCETIERITRRAMGTTRCGATREVLPPSSTTRRSGAGRKRGGSWARRRSSTAAALGSSGRITRSTKASVNSSPWGSRSRSDSSLAGAGTERVRAACSQERTCSATSSMVMSVVRCWAGFDGDNAVFSSVTMINGELMQPGRPRPML